MSICKHFISGMFVYYGFVIFSSRPWYGYLYASALDVYFTASLKRVHVLETDMSSPVVDDCSDAVASVVKSCERLSLAESDNCSVCTSNTDTTRSRRLFFVVEKHFCTYIF